MGKTAKHFTLPRSIPRPNKFSGDLKALMSALIDESWSQGPASRADVKASVARGISGHLDGLMDQGRSAAAGNADWLQEAQGGSVLGDGQWAPILPGFTDPFGIQASHSVSALKSTPEQLAREMYGPFADVFLSRLMDKNRSTPVAAGLGPDPDGHLGQPVYMVQAGGRDSLDIPEGGEIRGHYGFTPRVGIFAGNAAAGRRTDFHEATHAVLGDIGGDSLVTPDTAEAFAQWYFLNQAAAQAGAKVDPSVPATEWKMPDGSLFKDSVHFKQASSDAHVLERMASSRSEASALIADTKRDMATVQGVYPKSDRGQMDLFKGLMDNQPKYGVANPVHKHGAAAGLRAPGYNSRQRALKGFDELLKQTPHKGLPGKLWEGTMNMKGGPGGPGRSLLG